MREYDGQTIRELSLPELTVRTYQAWCAVRSCSMYGEFNGGYQEAIEELDDLMEEHLRRMQG